MERKRRVNMPKPSENKHKSYMDRKWAALEKRGLKRPKDREENARRAKEARGY